MKSPKLILIAICLAISQMALQCPDYSSPDPAPPNNNWPIYEKGGIWQPFAFRINGDDKFDLLEADGIDGPWIFLKCTDQFCENRVYDTLNNGTINAWAGGYGYISNGDSLRLWLRSFFDQGSFDFTLHPDCTKITAVIQDRLYLSGDFGALLLNKDKTNKDTLLLQNDEVYFELHRY